VSGATRRPALLLLSGGRLSGGCPASDRLMREATAVVAAVAGRVGVLLRYCYQGVGLTGRVT
jgi:hypothetical protein